MQGSGFRWVPAQRLSFEVAPPGDEFWTFLPGIPGFCRMDAFIPGLKDPKPQA